MLAGFETAPRLPHGLICLLRLCSESVRMCPATCGDTIHFHGCSVFCHVTTPPSVCLFPVGGHSGCCLQFGAWPNFVLSFTCCL